jgi:DNA-binding NtrC family response regulator
VNVLKIRVPPLRERGEDVAFLAGVFLEEAAADVRRGGLSLSEDALGALRGHRWPGNVRELRNVILRAAAMAPRAGPGGGRGLLVELRARGAPARRLADDPVPPAPEVRHLACFLAAALKRPGFERSGSKESGSSP